MNKDRLLRLRDIIGDSKSDPPIVPLIPVSKTTWYHGVKAGYFPPPIKFGHVSAWRLSDLEPLIVRKSASA